MARVRPLSEEHLELLRRAEALGINTFGYSAHNARLDKLRELVERGEAAQLEEEVDAEPVVGDLDSALALAGQTVDELKLINSASLPNDLIRTLHLAALGLTLQVQELLEEAVNEDNRVHPEDN